MRRTLFGKNPEVEYIGPRDASPVDALLFDVREHESSTDTRLAELRVAGWTYVPWLLFAGHLVVAASLLAVPGLASSMQTLAFTGIPVLIALALDIGAGLVISRWRNLQLSPHTIGRLMCAYVTVAGICSTVASAASTSIDFHAASFATVALGASFVVRCVASVASPPLAVINAALAVLTTALFSNDPLATSALNALAGLVLVYTVAVTRKTIAGGRQRLGVEWQARKALNFVDEFENTGRGWFWETDPLGTLSYVSKQLADDFNCEPEALLGRQFTDLLSVDTKGSDTSEERKTLGFHLSARFPFSDVVVRPASDQDVHWSLSGNPIFDERGRFLGFRGIGTDLTEQRRSEQEITRLARFDSLTGLPNRAMMRQTLEEALRNATNRQKGCTLFLIDLDRFKNVNDTLGHPIGDALLRQVADRLKSVMGEHGKVGRLGGDEFKAVLPGMVDVGLIESLARTLIEQVSRPYMIEGHKVTIGASVGVAIGDPGRTGADALVRNADLALYAAKGAGRGKHCFYEPSMHSEAAERQLLENDLRQAIERGELHMAYQPIVRAAGEEICGFEALVRWAHPTRGAISPDKFIPLAEEAGLIGRIGEWVLRTSLEEAARWPDQVRIAVNLSPLQFNDPGIVKLVARHLEETGIRPDRLELEITEGV
ncbi:diguanylate cyclase, partial [Sphingomonas sp.]|uniref:diguanylate cyclase domain-containing protein n=1 Tax=Sphingomonas sp. TaxID=28214 RepID=UPI0025F72073